MICIIKKVEVRAELGLKPKLPTRPTVVAATTEAKTETRVDIDPTEETSNAIPLGPLAAKLTTDAQVRPGTPGFVERQKAVHDLEELERLGEQAREQVCVAMVGGAAFTSD